MSESFHVVLVHQAGQVVHRGGTIDVTDGEPVRVHDFDDLEKAKEFCLHIVREAPAFKCQVYRGEEKVLEHANPSWVGYEQRRLRIAHTLAKRNAIRAAVACVGLGVVALIGFVPGGSHYLGPAMVGFLGLMILVEAGPLAFSSVPVLAPMIDSIGTKDPRAARIVCVLGIIIGLFILVFAIHSIVTQAGHR